MEQAASQIQDSRDFVFSGEAGISGVGKGEADGRAGCPAGHAEFHLTKQENAKLARLGDPETFAPHAILLLAL
jgi:hypothetical protein